MLPWIFLLALVSHVLHAESLSTNLMEDAKKVDQVMRPKAKRTQEFLMFGNQQNRQSENPSANAYVPPAEKRTLSTSGLEDAKMAFGEADKFSQPKLSGNGMFDREPSYEKNYEYGKVLVNQIGDEMPRPWELQPYPRFYGLVEDRRKRSDKSSSSTAATLAVSPSSTSAPVTSTSTSAPVVQAKRSLPLYQEPRYKRELDLVPEDIWMKLLSRLENGPRNRNMHNFPNDEYEGLEDENNVIELDDDESRTPDVWMNRPLYPSRHFAPESLSSDIGITRTHPPSFYEQYPPSQYDQQYGETYSYGETPLYGSLYPQQRYYQPEKRFMVSRKRSSNYEPYSGLAQLLGSQPRYLGYQHRLVY